MQNLALLQIAFLVASPLAYCTAAEFSDYFTTSEELNHWAHKSTGVAVIVEPRRHPLLSEVVLQFAEELPPTWRFHLFHGTANAEEAEAARQALEEVTRVQSSEDAKHRLALTNLGVATLFPKDVAYNRLLTSASFWYVLGQP